MKTLRTFKITLLLAGTAALAFTSCQRDEPPAPNTTNAQTFSPGGGFFILNEGGFTAGNSSVSYYSMTGVDSGSTFNNLYALANGVPLGDVAQSMAMINSRLYIVVNNSSKIVVVNPYNMGVDATITGLAGPRNIAQVDAQTALVTQMYSDQVAIVDLTTNTVTGYINLGVSSEAIITSPVICITSLESDKLYHLHSAFPSTGIDSSLVIAPGGNSMVVDANNKIWVLAYGYWATGAPGGLFRVNVFNTPTVEAAMPLTTVDYATHLNKNAAGDSLFFLNYNIYRMSINDGTLPTTPFISGAGHSFYTIGLLPNTSNFFAGDAVDYVQSGLIFRYNASGTQMDVDTVGVIPNNFLMY